jgi:RNA-directed DNA polymerase
MDGGELFLTEQGTMQGGPVSPLLANVALHGLENHIMKRFPRNVRQRFCTPQVIRYADDVVILHDDPTIIEQCKEATAEWLKEMGLELKSSKTRITHTLDVAEGKPGFDFLGFNIRQYPVGKTKSGKKRWGGLLGFKAIVKPSPTTIKRHLQTLREIVDQHKHAGQAALIKALNPVIRGWTNYYRAVASKVAFQKVEYELFRMLWAWARYRHSNKGKRWIAAKYWRFTKDRRWIFQPVNSELRLYQHGETRIRRHVKVQNRRSPYDGDWIYWSTRLGRHPEVSSKVTELLKRQQGRCTECGLFFKYGDVMEVDHIIPKEWGGSDSRNNRQLLHHHCHDVKTTRDAEILVQ